MYTKKIDYDELKEGFSKIREKKSASIALGEITSVAPPYPRYPEFFALQLLGEAVKRVINQFFSDHPVFGEDDRENIEYLIREGQRQGLSEMEIRVSKDLGANIELSVRAPFVNVPVGASVNLRRTNKGDYVIHVNFRVGKHMQDIEALEKYHKLRLAGALTDEEFERKKHEILSTYPCSDNCMKSKQAN